MTRGLLFVLLSVFAVRTAVAADAYVFRFMANGRTTPCAQAVWIDDVLFYNHTSAPASVRLLGISNGTLFPDTAKELVVPSQRVASLQSSARRNIFWRPAEPATMWVLHLDIPDGVLVDSRDEVYYRLLCGSIPEVDRTSAGKTSLPVFRSLVPAGKQQVILSTDLGERGGRLNVAIYNAADEAATAHIEVRNACDDVTVDKRDVAIPANTVMQFGPLSTSGPACSTSDAADWMRYTLVTVNQPSVSYVSNLTEAPLPTDVVPSLGYSVPINTEF